MQRSWYRKELDLLKVLAGSRWRDAEGKWRNQRERESARGQDNRSVGSNEPVSRRELRFPPPQGKEWDLLSVPVEFLIQL